jgi:hypothetical protein
MGERERTEAPRYAARVLERPVVDAEGVRHGTGDDVEEIAWARVAWAVAAEVGEPEGVRTIVFDLATGADEAAFHVLRLDAEPGEDAIALARAVERGLAAECKIPSIRSLAIDGIPARWYPDLASFEQEARAELAEVLGG